MASLTNLGNEDDANADLCNFIVLTFRALFGYRKTLLTLLVSMVWIATIVLSAIDNSLMMVPLPNDTIEESVLERAWLDLQIIGSRHHSYAQSGNDATHKYIESVVHKALKRSPQNFVDVDNDLNATNVEMWAEGSTVNYYESNNVVVRVNGTNSKLKALLLSAHFDSVPLSYGVTDDGMGIVLMLGVLYYLLQNGVQPERTVIFNFNNHEEFGLSGARTFISHPWFKEVGYFLNLEGTGAGGKAILFRGTDYEMVNLFRVRYPYANSLFQQGFANRLIRSETDYKVYKEIGGLRGLDLAFYKPRDIYHTTEDNIRHANKRSLWHMLSNALDFTLEFSSRTGELGDENAELTDPALYTSFLRFFFVLSARKSVQMGLVIAVVFPLVLGLLFFVVLHKQSWSFGMIDVIKVPCLLVILALGTKFVEDIFIENTNPLVPNVAKTEVLLTLFAVFIILNYILLNSINWITRLRRLTNHDEKLVVILELAVVWWVLMMYSIVKLNQNKPLDDHTGEFFITIVYVLQLAAGIVGLLGWSLCKRRQVNEVPKVTQENRLADSESDHLLASNDVEYGATEDVHQSSGQSLLLTNVKADSDSFSYERKSHSYDWWAQFLLTVAVPLYLIYNSGWLVLDGLAKLVQESLESQELVFRLSRWAAIAWALPFLPFVFKLNRFVVYLLLAQIGTGLLYLLLVNPFTTENPLKLYFLQTLDLSDSVSNHISVIGPQQSHLKLVLQDLPLVKVQGDKVNCESRNDGLYNCCIRLELWPVFDHNVKSYKDYIKVEVLKNSTDATGAPFGLLVGEIKIHTPKNRYCTLEFNETATGRYYRDHPVKTVIVYRSTANHTSTIDHTAAGIPEGFSIDKNGNYQFKRLIGINKLVLNKLDWDIEWHLGFHWVPSIYDDSEMLDGREFENLHFNVVCHWAELELVGGKEPIPAWKEVLKFSPVNVAWANQQKGLVAMRKLVRV